METIKFKTVSEGPLLKIELPEILDKESVQALLEQTKEWIQKATTIYALDFANVREFKPSCYQPLLAFAQAVKQNKKKIVSFSCGERVAHQIKLDGISTALNLVDDFKQYLKHELPSNSPGQLDINLINPFLSATKNTLERQAKTTCEPLKPFLTSVDAKTYETPIAIAGVISLSTDTFKGSITLVFTEKVFLQIYEMMFDEKHTSINHEIEDAAGELLNIIYGSAKTVLNQEMGLQLKPVLPTILSGERIHIRQQTTQKIIILPFKTQHGPFQIEISFDAVA
ncbi:MAG: chemotaxis protein CheX [Pseudobdellovibrio sp.]